MSFDLDIRNYYEHLTADEIKKQKLDQGRSLDELADLMCLTLNRLPARYIRHEVDMAFYLPQSERESMQKEVVKALKKALKHIEKAAQQDNE